MVRSSSRPHHSRPFTVGKAGTGTGSVRGGSPGRPGSGAGAGARSYLPPANMPETGISFTEFLEALAWVAVRGMRADGEGEGEGKEAGGGVGPSRQHFHDLFPTGTYAKVLALLTVWGLGSTDVLLEVLAMKRDHVSLSS